MNDSGGATNMVMLHLDQRHKQTTIHDSTVIFERIHVSKFCVKVLQPTRLDRTLHRVGTGVLDDCWLRPSSPSVHLEVMLQLLQSFSVSLSL